MKQIDLVAGSEVALIALTEPIVDNSSISIDIWGYHGQSAVIDISDADKHEVTIDQFEIVSHNYLELKFGVKKYLVKIKNLLLRSGASYLGGAEVLNLEIITNNPVTRLDTNAAGNVRIKAEDHEDETVIRKLLKSIEIIPGCGEYALNENSAHISLSQLKEALPNIRWIAPVAAWFADSLDIGKCKILPGVERAGGLDWKVAGYSRASAHVISHDPEGNINYGGSINDQGVLEYLSVAKSYGLNIIFYPLIMVDTPGKPWRGHLAGKAEDVEVFYQKYYKPFIIHYANLVKDKVDAFIIGSELVGLTRIHTQNNIFPFIPKLIELAGEVRRIMGKAVKLTYAADWSEYHTADGTLRPLDELWASPNIDFVGIDAYFPLTRLTTSRIPVETIKAGWNSGEGWDFWIGLKGEQNSFKNEGWNQWKNLYYWWSTEHWVWDEVTSQSIKTPWEPKKKPIWFTEFGFPSIDKAPNKPNVFYDPKCRDSGVPTYSNGKPDYAIQRKVLRATLEFWQESEFLENMICWTWDARGLDWHQMPRNEHSAELYYADGSLWQYGHWIDGKIGLPKKVIITGGLRLNSLRVEADFLYIKSLITTHKEEKHYGSKSVHKIYDENIKLTSVKVGKCDFVVGHFQMDGSVLYTGEMGVSARTVTLEAIVTDHRHEEIFTGKKDHITGQRNESTTIREWQTLYPVEIISNYAVFEVEKLFTAKAIKMKLNDMQLEAAEFEFAGIKLVNSISQNGKSKGGFFKSSKRYSSNSKYEGIEGIIIEVAGEAFMLASGKIWLAGTAIGASKLHLEAPKVELTSLIGSRYYGMQFSKSGTRFNFTCRPGELSAGLEMYNLQRTEEHYKEYAYSSILIGRDILTIRADALLQHGSSIIGDKGSVKAKEWRATVTGLLEYHTGTYSEIAVGAKIGFKENVSSFVSGARGFVNSLGQMTDGENKFAPINAGFSAYNTIVSLAQLLSGNVISFGGTITASGTFAGSESRHLTHEMSRARFNELDAAVEGTISGDLVIEALKATITAKQMELTKPEEEHHFESYGASLGVGLGVDLSGDASLGINLDYHQQLDDMIAGLGIGYDSKSGIGPVKVIYGEGEDILDISFKRTSLAEIQAAFSEGAMERIKENITSTLEDIRNFFKTPTAEEQEQYVVEKEYINDASEEREVSLESKESKAIKRDEQEKPQEKVLPQPIILSSDIKEENIISYGQVSLGTTLAAIEKHGFSQDFLNPVEILDINPAANLNNTNKCLVFLYDPSVASKENTEQETITYYIEGIGGIENGPSVGHFYAGLGKIENNSCIKQEIFGKNPAIEGAPIAKGAVNKEYKRYYDARKYEKQENTKVIMEVGVLVTEEKYQAVKNYIETQEVNSDIYVGHYQDCITFDNKILEIAGLEGVKVTDLIKPTDIKRFTLAKASAWLRSLDNKIVRGISAEDIAKDYGIATDRLVNVISAEHDILTFRILPYAEYLQKKN